MTHTLSFAINGLSCGGCAARAERALSAVEGLSDVHVNFASHQARVTLAHGADLDPALTALEQAGYPARIIQESFDIANLSCGGCVARAERAIGALGGVTDVTVNLATHQGQISYIEGLTSADEIRDLSHA
ncbi:MAG: heavy metal-associated domain-containing protein, partial [Paracoccaceae bacterium]